MTYMTKSNMDIALTRKLSRKIHLTIADKFALRTSIAMVSAALVGFYLHLDKPYWAVITVLMIMSPYVGATIKKSFLRIIGTLLGVGIGLLIIPLTIHSFFLYLCATFLLVFIGLYFGFNSKYYYVFFLCVLTAFMVTAVFLVSPEAPYYAAVWRSLEIITGVIVGMLAVVFIFPMHAKTTMTRHRMQLTALNQTSLDNLFMLYHNKIEQPNAVQHSIKALRSQLAKIQLTETFYKQDIGVSLIQQQLNRQFIEQQVALLDIFSGLQQHYQDNAFELLNNAELNLNLFEQTLLAYFDALHKDIDNKKIGKNIIEPVIQEYQQLKQRFACLRNTGALAQYPIEQVPYFYVYLNRLGKIVKTLKVQQHLAEQIYSKVKNVELKPIKKVKIFTFSHDPDYIKQCIKAGLSVVLTIILWMFVQWPGGLQGIISSFVMMTKFDLYSSQNQGLGRAVGCCLGGGVGLLSLHFIPYTTTDFIFIFFLATLCFSYLAHAGGKYAYIGIQANIAIAMTLAGGIAPPLSIAPALQRLSGIFLAIIATQVVSYFIWPAHPKKILARHTATLFEYFVETFPHLRQIEQASVEVEQDVCADIHKMLNKSDELFAIIKNRHRQQHKFVVRYQKIITKQHNIALAFYDLQNVDYHRANLLAKLYGIDLTERYRQIENILMQGRENYQQHLPLRTKANAEITLQGINQDLRKPRPSPFKKRLKASEVSNLITVLEAFQQIAEQLK